MREDRVINLGALGFDGGAENGSWFNVEPYDLYLATVFATGGDGTITIWNSIDGSSVQFAARLPDGSSALTLTPGQVKLLGTQSPYIRATRGSGTTGTTTVYLALRTERSIGTLS